MCNPTISKEDQEDAKIIISKPYDKKIIKVFHLKLLLVKKFENRVYNWSCKARETIFETINITNQQALVDI